MKPILPMIFLIPLFCCFEAACSGQIVNPEYRGQMNHCRTDAGQEDQEPYSVMMESTDDPNITLFGLGSFRGTNTWITTEAQADWLSDAELVVNGSFRFTDKTTEMFSLDLIATQIETGGGEAIGFAGLGYFIVDPSDTNTNERCEILLAPAN